MTFVNQLNFTQLVLQSISQALLQQGTEIFSISKRGFNDGNDSFTLQIGKSIVRMNYEELERFINFMNGLSVVKNRLEIRKQDRQSVINFSLENLQNEGGICFLA